MADPTWTRRRFLAASGLTAGAFALGACNISKGATVDQDNILDDGDWSDSIILDPPFEKPDVTFVDTDGKPYPLREKTKDRLTILGFGYTNCPDICPIYLQSIQAAQASLGSGPGSRPIVLFVGVDIARDTPAALKEYEKAYDMIGLTGTEEEMRKALDDLKLGQFEIGTPDAKGDYLVAHDARLTVFSPDNLAHRMYDGKTTTQRTFVRDLPRLDKITGSASTTGDATTTTGDA
jgi:protein SCO1/2